MSPRQLAMLPGSRLDKRIAFLKRLFPAMAAATVFIVFAMTLAPTDELSFVVARDKVGAASERLRAEQSVYRGIDSAGRPFTVRAGEAVQKSAAEPVVALQRLSAELALAEGPARIAAPSGRLFLEEDRVELDAPVAAAQAGYEVTSGAVNLDMDRQLAWSDRPVAGSIPLGRFRAGSFRAAVGSRVVTLSGGVHLRVEQGEGS